MTNAAVLPFSRRPEDEERALPPQNIETEESILGSLLFQSDSFDRIIDILTPEMFYINAHQELYKTLRDMYRDSEAIDVLTVSARLTDLGILEQIGGRSKIAMLIDRCISPVNIDYHAQIVSRLYWFRQMIKTGQNIIQTGYGQGDLGEAMNLVDSKIYSLVTMSTQQAEGDDSLSSLATTWFAELEEKMAGNGKSFPMTGFYDLDAMTNGLRPGRLTVLMARPGQGKTTFVLNVARNLVRSSSKAIALFSLEMPKEDIFTRLMSAEARIDSRMLETGQHLSPAEIERSVSALATLTQLPLHINDTCCTVESIRAQARKLAKRPEGLSLVIIDHLIYMLKGSTDPVRDAGKITKGLVELSKELEIPIVLATQLNRAVESRQDKRPIMSDARLSGEIEEDAHNIWALYRDEYYNPNTSDRGIAELINLKNRSGATGTVRLLFEPQYGTFKNIASSRRSEPPQPFSLPPASAPVPEPDQPLVSAPPVAIEASIEALDSALFDEDEDDLDF
jgi:replicative DNA helicase